jgi:hypothetical protein
MSRSTLEVVRRYYEQDKFVVPAIPGTARQGRPSGEGPRSKRLKSLGSRFRGNDAQSLQRYPRISMHSSSLPSGSKWRFSISNVFLAM